MLFFLQQDALYVRMFANVTAALQWGSGTDGTVYSTTAMGNYNTFHKISHQTDSDITNGNDAFAREAHAEIDRIRMTTFSHVLQVFSDRGLFDQSFIFLTNALSSGRDLLKYFGVGIAKSE